MVLPFAPTVSLIAFTKICTFTSLLPATTNAAPLCAVNAFAAASIPAFKVASTPLIVPPFTAFNKPSAIAPISEGRHKYFSSALEPVILATVSKWICLLIEIFFSSIFLPTAYCFANSTGLNQVPKKSALKETIAFALSKW